MGEKKHHHRHYHLGGWVAPLCPVQFSGSPQADVLAPTDSGPGDGTGAAGDAGGAAV
jgi:hypothetical protein